MIFFLCNL